MMDIAFRKIIKTHDLIQEGQAILVAVSGGKDSMYLLEFLCRLQKEMNVQLAIAHINHKQRPESDQEETTLRQLAKELAIPMFVRLFEGDFSEKKARDFRYAFFEELMHTKGYQVLATAHHADDQSETVLMRLIRGSRLRHLSSIPLKQNFGPGVLIRPLLGFFKEDLKPTCYFEDESNKSDRYFRNRVRNHYLPLLEKENPKLREALCELSRQATLYQAAFKDLIQGLDYQDLSVFQGQTPAVQELLLEDYLGQVPDLQVKRGQFQDLLRVLQKNGDRCIPIKSGYFLMKQAGRFWITNQMCQPKPYVPVFLYTGDCYDDDEMTVAYDRELPEVDQEIITGSDSPVIIRQRQSGDSLVINGVRKKLRRYFIDSKIPRHKRDKIKVIEQDGAVLGLVGVVTSDLRKGIKHDTIDHNLKIKLKE